MTDKFKKLKQVAAAHFPDAILKGGPQASACMSMSVLGFDVTKFRFVFIVEREEFFGQILAKQNPGFWPLTSVAMVITKPLSTFLCEQDFVDDDKLRFALAHVLAERTCCGCYAKLDHHQGKSMATCGGRLCVKKAANLWRCSNCSQRDHEFWGYGCHIDAIRKDFGLASCCSDGLTVPAP